jgi:glycosyltransferase involved in cell wall biosynthesis
MIISLLHPSYGRPQKARETYEYWMSQASGNIEIEHILSIDFSDPLCEDYEMINTEDGKEFKRFGANSRSIIDHNSCVVEATNQAAQACKGDILIYLSDDFKCPKDWDVLLLNEFAIAGDGPWLLKVNDGLQKYDVTVLTIPIMNRELYNKLGYFWHPEYKSMHVDVDLFFTVQNIGALKHCRNLLFQHEHHSLGKCENDETYKRSEANWYQGLEVFNRRKALNFPI